jgi:hypothetical protein
MVETPRLTKSNFITENCSLLGTDASMQKEDKLHKIDEEILKLQVS